MKKFSDFLKESKPIFVDVSEIQKFLGVEKVSLENKKLYIKLKDDNLESNTNNLIKKFLKIYRNSKNYKIKDIANEIGEFDGSFDKNAFEYFKDWDFDKFLDNFGIDFVLNDKTEKKLDKICKDYDILVDDIRIVY